MTVALPPVVRATEDDLPQATICIAKAFSQLRVCEWLLPNLRTAQRVPIMRAQMDIVVRHAFRFGEIYMTSSGQSVAVWEQDLLPPIENYAERLREACGIYVERFEALDRMLSSRRPTEPHHHLALMATMPAMQSGGGGSALLNSYHQRLDQFGEAAGLVASCGRSRELYLRYGYQNAGQVISFPNGAVMYPMWRPPRTPLV
jgi:GNAT superfamily N-acetyltransferase